MTTCAETQTPRGKIYLDELFDFRGINIDETAQPYPSLQKKRKNVASEVGVLIISPSAVTFTPHAVRHNLLFRVYAMKLAQIVIMSGMAHFFIFWPPASHFVLSQWWGWIVGYVLVLVIYITLMCGPVWWRTESPVNAILFVLYTLVMGGAYSFLVVDLVTDKGDYQLWALLLFDPPTLFLVLMYLTVIAASCQTKYPLVRTRPLGYLFCLAGTTYKLLIMVAQVALVRVLRPAPPPSSLCIFAVVVLEVGTIVYFYIMIILTQYMLEGRFDVTIHPKNSVAAMLYMQEGALYMVAYYVFFSVKSVLYCLGTFIKRKHQPRANYVYRKYFGTDQDSDVDLKTGQNTIVLQ